MSAGPPPARQVKLSKAAKASSGGRSRVSYNII